MKISVALTTYNGALHLEEQLQSLASQTLLPHELVIADDGSTDDTLSILRQFAACASFSVKIHLNAQRLGYTDNFIQVASLCEGDWIAFCDQDDIWLPEKLREISRAARKDTTLIVHPVQPVDAELRPLDGQSVVSRLKSGSGPFRLATFGYFSGLGIAFRRECLNLISYRPRFPDRHDPSVEAAHDEWICALADALGGTRKINKRLVLYRQHGSNTCGAWIKKATDVYPAGEFNAHERYAKLALSYANCFKGMLSSIPLGAGQRKSLEIASLHYLKAHRYFALRARLYRSPSAWGRLAAWAKLTAAWLYRFNPGALPALACFKDLIAAILRFRVAAALKGD
jgi:glycosyltransferase involved in cell wall biosynthesis